MKGARKFFTPEEQDKINRAVVEAEKSTSGEIVPVVATASGRYDRAEDLAGLLLGLAALTASWLWFQRIVPVQGDWEQGQRLTLGLPWILLIVIVGFVVGATLASRIGWLRRLFVLNREMHEEVQRAAWQAFGNFRVGRTAAGTGILLYVSLFEQMVCVVGDDPIAARLDQKTWDEIRDMIIGGMRGRRAANAFCQAITRCGELLSQHFPYQMGDVNELSDELRMID